MKEMNELPEWLQELWEVNPVIARKAEAHINNCVSKKELANHLAQVINGCVNTLNELKPGIIGWEWETSKKTLAENILIKFT